ncbi:MAG: FAD-dependent oxidoreductase [Ignavibacteriales bacterium]|nr:FAD-dependent oxidoreductase [Ignavibacteriales bacterium]
MTNQQAGVEAERCLQCFDAPCVHACPTHIQIPTFISMIKSGNIRGAAEVVKTSNAMANVCGKICPEEVYCQSVCNRAKEDTPIQIRELHFFATQSEARKKFSELKPFPKSGKQVAVIGGGPTGIGCAFELSKFGYKVTLFDEKGMGGVPKSSIPLFRLTESELQDDLKFLSTHFSVKKEKITDAKFSQLKNKFDAIYLGIGLGKDRSLGLKGENLRGVYLVLEFLETAKVKQKKMSIGKKVVVVGGGNVSLDAAATAKRLGASEVILIYRRSESEMKVWKSELEEARKQGVEIRFLTNPIEIIGTKRVSGIKCRRTTLSKKKDESGRLIPVEVKGSDFILEADTVIIAIGQSIGSDIVNRFKRNSKGFIAVDKNYQTSMKSFFAGGDAISGEGTIVQSVAHGKQAAHAIHKSLSIKKSK